MSCFHKLVCKNTDLQLLGTLNGGQSFRWKKIKQENGDVWMGVFKNRLWVLKQDCNHILYRVYESEVIDSHSEYGNATYDHMLREYFQLDLNLDKCYKKWSQVDPYFKEASKQFYGIRILKQSVTENIFSFICSSNNHISRISSMVEKLAVFYGDEICELDGEKYYSFPTVEKLAQSGVENKLRSNGFGYRAKYISETAQSIMANGGDSWLNELKNKSYGDAKRSLMTLTGVGAKVADCICLMSLGHLSAIPVDTHIYQIAARLYIPKLPKQKTITEKIYNEIGDHFRSLYGPLAGWAHTVLFCADLKKFQENNNQQDSRQTIKKKLKLK